MSLSDFLASLSSLSLLTPFPTLYIPELSRNQFFMLCLYGHNLFFWFQDSSMYEFQKLHSWLYHFCLPQESNTGACWVSPKWPLSWVWRYWTIPVNVNKLSKRLNWNSVATVTSTEITISLKWNYPDKEGCSETGTYPWVCPEKEVISREYLQWKLLATITHRNKGLSATFQ